MPPSLSRRSQVEPFHAMDVLAQANRLRAAGHDVISMAVGQPSDPAPQAVRAAAVAAISAGRIGYTDALGRRDLREAIARHYGDHYGLDVPAERIVVTTGSSAGFNLAFLALFDAGDRVAISRPGYPAYRNILKALGVEAVEIDLRGEGNLTVELLGEAHARAPLKGVLFASPANPTGAGIARQELERLVRFGRDAGLHVISDEIYHRLNHAGPDCSALAFGDDVVVINSFSKYYCMTGWRIGWMVLPESAIRAVERIQQSLYISAPELSQVAAMAAFGATDELERVKARYRENRALLLDGLPKLGFRIAAPMDGAFYAWCDVSALTNDSKAFAQALLVEAGVAITPGHDFDPVDGDRTARLSYAGASDDMAQALARIGDWLVRRG